MIGYACMNRTLRDSDRPVRANRGMQKATWQDRGQSYAEELLQKNLIDLKEIFHWNLRRDISFYRCSSDLVPWATHWDIQDASQTTKALFTEVGSLIRDHDIRFSFHPAHFATLGSPSEQTRENAVAYVNAHGRWMDMMGLPRNPYYAINIHIGGVYGDKEATANRWVDTYERLDRGAKSRLVVENDDSSSGWCVSELADISDRCGVPVTFDYHHHQFSSEGLCYREAFDLAESTWPCRPITHYSEPACLWGEDKQPQAHADWVDSIPGWLSANSDVMVEAGQKERSILRIR